MLCEINVKIQHNLLHTAASYLCTQASEVSQGGMKINRSPIPSPLSWGGVSGERVQSNKRMRKRKAYFFMHAQKTKIWLPIERVCASFPLPW